MNARQARAVPAAAAVASAPPMLRERLRVIVADRADAILAEVPDTLRRLRTFLLVLAISVPLFFAGLIAVLLWFVS